jgi:hypothetical protein
MPGYKAASPDTNNIYKGYRVLQGLNNHPIEICSTHEYHCFRYRMGNA